MNSGSIEKRLLSEVLQAVAGEIECQHVASLGLQQALDEILNTRKELLNGETMAAFQNLDKLSQSLAYLSSYIGNLAETVCPDSHASINIINESGTFVSIHKRLFSAKDAVENIDIEIF